MADGDNVECSISHNSNIMSSSLDGNTISDLRVEEVKEAVSPICDKLQLAWSGDFSRSQKKISINLRIVSHLN